MFAIPQHAQCTRLLVGLQCQQSLYIDLFFFNRTRYSNSSSAGVHRRAAEPTLSSSTDCRERRVDPDELCLQFWPGCASDIDDMYCVSTSTALADAVSPAHRRLKKSATVTAADAGSRARFQLLVITI